MLLDLRGWRRLASRLGLFNVTSKVTLRDGGGYEITLESSDTPIEELVALSTTISFDPPQTQDKQSLEGYS